MEILNTLIELIHLVGRCKVKEATRYVGDDKLRSCSLVVKVAKLIGTDAKSLEAIWVEEVYRARAK